VPEGDIVWNTAQVLRRGLVSRQLIAADFRVPQLATTTLARWTVAESLSRGKHLLLRLTAPDGSQPMTLHSHLRMDGAWRVYPAGARWTGGPAHVIRVVLRTSETVAVGYHLHEVALVRTAEEHLLVGHLGPDLLGPDWDPAEAVRRLAAHPDTPIAEALMDQRNIAGIGNFFKAELMFLHGLWPWTPVRDVPDLAKLVGLAHRALKANTGRWTQSTTGSLRRGEESYVYGRRSAPCRRCGTLIRKVDQGERITFWCPHCQPEPDAKGW
jgi:endonuclease-8